MRLFRRRRKFHLLFFPVCLGGNSCVCLARARARERERERGRKRKRSEGEKERIKTTTNEKENSSRRQLPFLLHPNSSSASLLSLSLTSIDGVVSFFGDGSAERWARQGTQRGYPGRGTMPLRAAKNCRRRRIRPLSASTSSSPRLNWRCCRSGNAQGNRHRTQQRGAAR